MIFPVRPAFRAVVIVSVTRLAAPRADPALPPQRRPHQAAARAD
jgi:hypothetical protein